MQSARPSLEIVLPRMAFMTDVGAEIIRYAADAFDAGIKVALVTLVDIRGGAARPLGAQMAVREDGLYCGFVSGGCTETAVAAEALEALQSRNDRYLLLGEGSKFFDIVLPCGGGLRLAIHVLRSSKALRAVLFDLGNRRRAGLCYDPGRHTLISTDAPNRTGWDGEIFAVRYRPAPRIVLHGRSIEAEKTSQLAVAAGFEVVIHDGQQLEPIEAGGMDLDTAVVLLHHDMDREIPTLQAALSVKPFYIGALGSGRTHKRRSEVLRSLGFSEADIARIKAPIGIFRKARDAGTLALSVLADVAEAYSLQ